MTHSPARPGWAAAIARGLCPRCRQGRVFRGLIAMNETCPFCEHRFERETGFFVGAMYISYGIAVVIYLILTALAIWALPGRPQSLAFGVAFLLFLPFVPFIFRYSRLIWLHFDWVFDPGP